VGRCILKAHFEFEMGATMKAAKDWIWMVMVGLMLGVSAHAAKVYSFSGKISHISGNDIEVTRGSEAREFAMSGLTVDQKDVLKVGDEITLWYTMEAQGMTRQQAGRAGNLKSEPPQSPSEQESSPVPPSIQDDRAFYNAKVDLSMDGSQGA
jgi:hypothetical protein